MICKRGMVRKRSKCQKSDAASSFETGLYLYSSLQRTRRCTEKSGKWFRFLGRIKPQSCPSCVRSQSKPILLFSRVSAHFISRVTKAPLSSPAVETPETVALSEIEKFYLLAKFEEERKKPVPESLEFSDSQRPSRKCFTDYAKARIRNSFSLYLFKIQEKCTWLLDSKTLRKGKVLPRRRRLLRPAPPPPLQPPFEQVKRRVKRHKSVLFAARFESSCARADQLFHTFLKKFDKQTESIEGGTTASEEVPYSNFHVNVGKNALYKFTLHKAPNAPCLCEFGKSVVPQAEFPRSKAEFPRSKAE